MNYMQGGKGYDLLPPWIFYCLYNLDGVFLCLVSFRSILRLVSFLFKIKIEKHLNGFPLVENASILSK